MLKPRPGWRKERLFERVDVLLLILLDIQLDDLFLARKPPNYYIPCILVDTLKGILRSETEDTIHAHKHSTYHPRIPSHTFSFHASIPIFVFYVLCLSYRPILCLPFPVASFIPQTSYIDLKTQGTTIEFIRPQDFSFRVLQVRPFDPFHRPNIAVNSVEDINWYRYHSF